MLQDPVVIQTLAQSTLYFKTKYIYQREITYEKRLHLRGIFEPDFER
ncbi:MAG: hypothetical protein ACI9UR_001117 [Bacteroidia bacterium]